jgi:hypothetical protein
MIHSCPHAVKCSEVNCLGSIGKGGASDQRQSRPDRRPAFERRVSRQTFANIRRISDEAAQSIRDAATIQQSCRGGKEA